MSEWDCPECGKKLSAMLTPIDYRDKTFCGKECLAAWKARPHRKPRKEYDLGRSRSPAMGVWRNRQESRLWEDSQEAQ